MSQIIEVKVPDIGNFHDVPIIELSIKPGDSVKAEDPLMTLESDKATIDIPSPSDGVIKEFKVKVGDKVSQGTLVALIETLPGATAAFAESATVTPAVAPTPPQASQTSADTVGRYTGSVDLETDMLVLGAGPGGYSAAFRSADLGMKTTDNGSKLHIGQKVYRITAPSAFTPDNAAQTTPRRK